MRNYTYICAVNQIKKEMKITEFAKLTGVHPMTVRRWIKEKRIVAVKVTVKGFATAYDIPLTEIQKVTPDKCDK